ncbi:MAG TPA: hypothetical protein VFL45_10420, partial [Gammaproteobacteria bacterium]|nr:hypothetical protein [Gammaproteobacteria bacterium]
LGAAALVLAACASSTSVPSDLGINDAPDWVNKGGQALDNHSGRLIHGIGSAPTMNDLSLQMSTADERARAEVARVLSSFMHVVSQDYAASAGLDAERQNDASVSREIENFTRQNVSGARIIAHWRNPKNGSLWSLAELDLKQVKSMVANSNEMNAGFKAYFQSHADNLFDGMTGGAS